MDRTEGINEVGEERPPGDKGLKANAIGFVNALGIGLGANAPAYSLAAVLGLLVITVGAQAPVIILASFVPMLFIATAFYYMNRVDQDCGTTFSWVTRAMGSTAGWMSGWAVFASLVLVVGSLADVAARYGFLLVGWERAAGSSLAVAAFAVGIIAVMTMICSRGIEISSRVQIAIIVAQISALLIFSFIALARVFGGDATEASMLPQASWFSPFAVADGGAFVSGLLIGVFIYWGWEASVTVTEEIENAVHAPGRAAILSTVILVSTYLSVTVAVVAFAGVGVVGNFADDDAILGIVATDVLGQPWDKLVVLAVFTAALGATQGLLIPASRTLLSMSRAGAMPARLGEVHPRFRTPHIATIVVGVLGALWYVPVKLVSENTLYDTILGLSLLVAFYYSMTGFACVVYYRREIFKSVKNFLFIGVMPLLGAIALAFVFFRSLMDLADPSLSYTGSSVFDFGLPMVIGVGFLLLGAMLLILWRMFGESRAFFNRRPETVDPEAAAGKTKLEPANGTPVERVR